MNQIQVKSIIEAIVEQPFILSGDLFQKLSAKDLLEVEDHGDAIDAKLYATLDIIQSLNGLSTPLVLEFKKDISVGITFNKATQKVSAWIDQGHYDLISYGAEELSFKGKDLEIYSADGIVVSEPLEQDDLYVIDHDFVENEITGQIHELAYDEANKIIEEAFAIPEHQAKLIKLITNS